MDINEKEIQYSDTEWLKQSQLLVNGNSEHIKMLVNFESYYHLFTEYLRQICLTDIEIHSNIA